MALSTVDNQNAMMLRTKKAKQEEAAIENEMIVALAKVCVCTQLGKRRRYFVVST